MPESVKKKEHRVPLWGIFLLFLGIIFLLQTFNILPWNLWGVLWRFWPVALIIIGLNFLLVRYNRWLVGLLFLGMLFVCLGVAMSLYSGSAPPPRTSAELYSEKLNDIESARIETDFTALDVYISGLPAGAPDLLWVKNGTASRGIAEINSQRAEGKEDFYLRSKRQDWRLWHNDSEAQSSLRINADVALFLHVKSALSNLRLDLGGLNVTGLRIDTGLSNCRVVLPSSGASTVWYIKADLANLELLVPEGVAARFIIDSDLSAVDVNESRFIKKAGYYETKDFEWARERIEVDIDCDLSRVKVDSSKRPTIITPKGVF